MSHASDATRPFSHPAFGKEVRIQQLGREVHLIFVASTTAQADSLANDLLEQLKAGAVRLTMMGRLTSIVDENGPDATKEKPHG